VYKRQRGLGDVYKRQALIESLDSSQNAVMYVSIHLEV
jgi:hypothetical protein